MTTARTVTGMYISHLRRLERSAGGRDSFFIKRHGRAVCFNLSERNSLGCENMHALHIGVSLVVLGELVCLV
jgi:hypothetical protein